MPIESLMAFRSCCLQPKIALSGLDADVPEQELNLFQLATTLATQASTRPTKVMRRDIITKGAGCVSLLNHAPDNLGTEAVRGNSPRFIDRAKDRAVRDLASAMQVCSVGK
jgi:hypothetical protein